MLICSILLEGDEGYFVTDGYAGYNKVTGGTRCDCWAHVRRKFLEAIPGGDPTDEQAQGSKAREGFEFCEKLFILEREYAALSPEERQAECEKQSRPMLEAFWTGKEPLPAAKVVASQLNLTNWKFGKFTAVVWTP